MTNKNSVDIPVLVAEREATSTKKTRKQQANRRPPSNGAGTQIWVVLLLVILTVVAVAAGYTLKLQQNTIDKLILQQASLNINIEKLNSNILQSDNTIINNETQINSQLNLFDSEIRKLWDVANKRNKEWIQQNTQKLEGLATSMANNNQQAVLNELSEQIQALQLSQQSISERVQQLDRFDEQLNNINQAASSSMDNNADTLIGITLAQEAIQARQVEFDSQLSQFSKQFDQVNQSIDAIDQHRLKLSQDLSALQQHSKPQPADITMPANQELDILEPNEF